jgi:hypothetical protein
MKNLKQILAIVIMAIASNAIQAQVKIGNNPTNITTNVNLEIEATNGVKSVFSKDLGNVGIGTTNTTTLGNLNAIPSRLNVLGAGGNTFISKFVGTSSDHLYNRVWIEGANGSMFTVANSTTSESYDFGLSTNFYWKRTNSFGYNFILSTLAAPTNLDESNNIILGSAGASAITGAQVLIVGDAGEASLVTNDNVGIGTLSPTVKLDVNGYIKVGNTDTAGDATPAAGMIRYNNTTSKFQGYVGGATPGWVDLN